MKLSRKIKYTLLFFICWFALLTFIVDGVLKFENVLHFFGDSYAITETTLIALVLVPTAIVYIFTKKTK